MSFFNTQRLLLNSRTNFNDVGCTRGQTRVEVGSRIPRNSAATCLKLFLLQAELVGGVAKKCIGSFAADQPEALHCLSGS